jgi:hypothetical protein
MTIRCELALSWPRKEERHLPHGGKEPPGVRGVPVEQRCKCANPIDVDRVCGGVHEVFPLLVD